jgi:transposase
VLKNREVLFQFQGANELAGIVQFWKQLKALPGFELQQALFCMEHTGIYNRHIVNFLHVKKSAVCLESSIHIKLSSGLQRGKNDKLDSLRIALYAHKNRLELKLWQPKRKIIEQLKELSGLRSRLLNAKKQLSTALKESASFDSICSKESEQLCRASLQALDKDVKKVETLIDNIIASDDHLKRLFAITTSVKGIGKITATAMIVYSNEFKDISEPAKFACYAGVAPFEHSSGSSVRRRTRVSHQANKTMKTLLHMAAVVAVCYNPDLKAYYQRKVEQNKNKMLVINAVRNKLIWRVYACVKNNRFYEENVRPTLA